jgi:hypothetical protein
MEKRLMRSNLPPPAISYEVDGTDSAFDDILAARVSAEVPHNFPGPGFAPEVGVEWHEGHAHLLESGAAATSSVRYGSEEETPLELLKVIFECFLPVADLCSKLLVFFKLVHTISLGSFLLGNVSN